MSGMVPLTWKHSNDCGGTGNSDSYYDTHDTLQHPHLRPKSSTGFSIVKEMSTYLMHISTSLTNYPSLITLASIRSNAYVIMVHYPIYRTLRIGSFLCVHGRYAL